MSNSLVPAYIAHASPGRVRLRIPRKRGDAAYFAHLCEQLAIRRGIVSVSANPSTGGGLLGLAPSFDIAEIGADGRTLSLFDLDNSPKASAQAGKKNSVLITASAGFKQADRLIDEATGGSLDLKSSVFLVLLALAARQIIRGHFMVPGFTLVWHALSMMME